MGFFLNISVLSILYGAVPSMCILYNEPVVNPFTGDFFLTFWVLLLFFNINKSVRQKST